MEQSNECFPSHEGEMRLGIELRRLRNNCHLKLRQVSTATGLSVSFLSDMERGRTRPSLGTLEKLASFYQVSASGILRRAEQAALEAVREK